MNPVKKPRSGVTIAHNCTFWPLPGRNTYNFCLTACLSLFQSYFCADAAFVRFGRLDGDLVLIFESTHNTWAYTPEKFGTFLLRFATCSVEHISVSFEDSAVNVILELQLEEIANA